MKPHKMCDIGTEEFARTLAETQYRLWNQEGKTVLKIAVYPSLTEKIRPYLPANMMVNDVPIEITDEHVRDMVTFVVGYPKNGS